MTSQLTSEPVSQTDPEDILLDHNYDGIQEYDNPLPGWWKFLFWLFIFFAPLYYLYFHFGVEGRTVYDQYDRQMASIFEMKFKQIGELTPDRETITKYMNDPEWRAVGKVVFKTNCVSCHGADGQGAIGPNLTDDNWKNVRHVEDIAKVISEGAANGSMPAWKNRMSHINQVVLTAAYIASLRENPIPVSAGGKLPEGNVIPPWGE